MHTEDINTSYIESQIDRHAASLEFVKMRDREPDRRTYVRAYPPASVMFRMHEPEHAMLRGIGEFDRWLTKVFDK